VIALPIIIDNVAVGVLVIYAKGPDAFDDGEVELLSEMTDDLAYGINAIRTREKQREGEKALIKREQDYRLLFENVTDVIFSMDMDMKITSLSPSIEEMLGYEPEDIIGKTILEAGFLSEESLEVSLGLIESFSGGEPVRKTIEMKFICKDGTEKYGEVTGTPVMQDDEIIAFIAIVRDIADRKRAEMLEKERARDEIFGFITSAIPVFVANVPNEARNALIRSFGIRFEKYIQPRFEKDMAQAGVSLDVENITEQDKLKLFDAYLSWIANLFENFGMKTNIEIQENNAHLVFSSCPWMEDKPYNPVYCLLGRAMVFRSFTWTGLQGNAEQRSSMAAGSNKCDFEYTINLK
jgi:PAS domain S-box-containing protein